MFINVFIGLLGAAIDASISSGRVNYFVARRTIAFLVFHTSVLEPVDEKSFVNVRRLKRETAMNPTKFSLASLTALSVLRFRSDGGESNIDSMRILALVPTVECLRTLSEFFCLKSRSRNALEWGMECLILANLVGESVYHSSRKACRGFASFRFWWSEVRPTVIEMESFECYETMANYDWVSKSFRNSW